ncbi:AAA family ATPase [Brevundimonas albigilva]|uniref:AAA family ATPase n=1 Tax=Brevundimonas albigilva TaxID=1312364 RepID=A0ABY4SMK7_9CAUL|nr:AAA family ATPase [Brevundimonas albigilva]URI15962.1 AAA family ATPase [Brevundimonas albigilva]
MIIHADIYHYKSIAEAHVDFTDVNVIVGMNGVGKSNVVDAISFISDCLSEDLDTAITRRHGIESVRQWSRTRPYHVTIELHIRNRSGSGRLKVTIESGRGGVFSVGEEEAHWQGFHPFGVSINDEEPRTFTSSYRRLKTGKVEYSTDVDEYTNRVKDYSPYPLAPTDLLATSIVGSYRGFESLLFGELLAEIKDFVPYSIYPNTLRQPQIVSKEESLLPDGSNMASIVKTINSGHKRNKESLLDALKVVLPISTDILVKSAGGYYVPVIQVREPSGDQHQLNMSQVSDGTLRVLGILSALYQVNAPALIALEEPEQMVHPGVLPVISDAVADFVSKSGPGRQVFVTTHSPVLLDQFPPESIIWANFNNGVTECGRVSDRQMSLIKRQLFTAGEILTSEGFF